MNESTDWIEKNAANLIRRARASQYSRDIFADAAYFRTLGFVGDVALAKSCSYWLS